MQNLFEMHRQFWTFSSDRDPKMKELIAREQLKLIGIVSRTVSLAIIPVTVYLIVHLFYHASAPFIAAGISGITVAAYILIRNFFRQEPDDADIDRLDTARKMFCTECIIVTFAFNLSIAFPLAFGQIPFDRNAQCCLSLEKLHQWNIFRNQGRSVQWCS